MKPHRTVLFIILLTSLTWAQARLTVPGTTVAPGSADCLRNPSAPGCAEARNLATPDQLKMSDDAPTPSVVSSGQVVADDPPTEFQEFVASGIGGRLPIFGYSLFSQVPSTFAPVDRIPVPATYVLGPGDELVIRAWGQIDLDARVSIDRTGAIYLPRVGSLMVAGLQYQQLPDFLKTSIGRIYKNFDLVATLGQLRTIQVLILGNARKPGMYTVSSLSTLVNTLFASGGPSNRGSMRQIQLKRSGRVITTFDVYDLLLKGDKSKDVLLLPDDLIYIPPVGPQVAMAGSINAPAIYELSGMTTLRAQIEAAGGMTSVADGDRATVERIDDHSRRKIEEFTLDEAGLRRELHDGDVVRLFAISPKIENAVTLRGNVARPGRYSWREGMHVRDLIPNREFLLTRGYWHRQNAGTDETGESRNDVNRSAHELNWEYAVVQRMDHNTLATKLLPFNLGKAMMEENESENVALEPGDIVTVFSQGDIAVPIEKRTKFVRLEGEFRAPGVYRAEPGESLHRLIQRAGGFTDRAYLFGAVFSRESARVEQQKSLDEMVRNLEITVQRNSMANAQRGDASATLLQAQADQALLDKLRRLRATGRVVLDSRSPKKSALELPDLELEDGDKLFVPSESSTVTVVGAVYNPNSFVFKPNTRLGSYLQLAGSGTRDADTKHMFVVRVDGSVVSSETSSAWSGGIRGLRSLPGDMLVVPPQTEKGTFFRGLKDWSQVISQFGLGAAAAFVFTR